ncbi:MAG: hypothetical protein R3E13_01625 [Alphaproteobacteria bacterium]
MSAILEALTKLEQSIGNLENAAGHVEATLSGQQRDMFTAAPQAVPAANLNVALVAEKLDTIIEQAETVLKESHG